MSYPCYDSYKSAKTALGDIIPAHWEEWKASHGFGMIGSGTTPKSDSTRYYEGETLWITTAELRENYVFDTANKVTAEALLEHTTLKIYPIESVAIAMYGATIGRLGMLGKEATVNQACCVFSMPEKFYPRFFYYWLWMKRPVLISLSLGGGQPNLNQEELKRLKICTPTIAEQHQIAAFLDWKTAQIDALIAKKKELIEKLKENRLAVITQAVTKGVDPAARLRDSGIAWLEKIPTNWATIPLGFLTTMRGGATPSMANAAYWDGDVPWVTPKDMKQARIGDSIDHVTTQAVEESALALIPTNTILIVVRGMILAHSFPAAITTAPVTINQDMKALHCEDKLTVEYLFWCLTGFAKIFSNMAQESAHGTRKMTTETIKKFVLPVPSLAEQHEITRVLARRLQKLDDLAQATNTTITHLTEYRTALITAATTGKIDVRNVRIPDTAPAAT